MLSSVVKVSTPDDERSTVAVALGAEPREVVLHLDLERGLDHPPRPLARELVERRTHPFLQTFVLNYVPHRRTFPGLPGPSSRCRYAGGDATFLSSRDPHLPAISRLSVSFMPHQESEDPPPPELPPPPE